MKRPVLIMAAMLLWLHPVPFTDISGRLLPRTYRRWIYARNGQIIGPTYYDVVWSQERGRRVRSIVVYTKKSFPYIQQ